MKKLFSLVCICFCSMFLFSMQAFAKTEFYVVAPFKIIGDSQYEYLANSVPSMFASRIFSSGNYETSPEQDIILKEKPPLDNAHATQILNKVRADYIFYGTITILGSEASLDITALNRNGQQWKKAVITPVEKLITGIQGIADDFNKEIFINKTDKNASTKSTIPNERLRSQTFNYAAISMDIGAITGVNAKNIVLADDLNVYVYDWNDGAMREIAKYKVPNTQRILAVRTFLQQDKTLIAVSAFSEGEGAPLGTILEYEKGNKTLQEVAKRLPWYLGTVTLPNATRKTLIGQQSSSYNVFHGNIFEVVYQNGKYVRGTTIPKVPANATPYNFTYFQENNDRNYKVAMYSRTERIQIYSSTGDRLHETEDNYSGGNAYIRTADGKIASSFSDDIIEFYYIPIRLLATKLNGTNQILANLPNSTLAKFLANYRNYSSGEVYSLKWDGIGLETLWKTRKINGTVADFNIADVNNDGMEDLVTCVVTYPGSFGFGDKKTVITILPLDSEAMTLRHTEKEE